jgi:CRISPR system Cascade subunit CasC
VNASELDRLPPVEAAREAARLIESSRGDVSRWASARARYVAAACATMPVADVADELGISEQMVRRLRNEASTTPGSRPATPRFLDIHIVQTIPFGALNRDDAGGVKTCRFGGVTRTRVSSQAWKRAAYEALRASGAVADLGVNTREAPRLISAEIANLAPELADTADELATRLLDGAKIPVVAPAGSAGRGKRDAAQADTDRAIGRTEAMLRIGRRQVEALARIAVEAERAGHKAPDAAVTAALLADLPVSAALHGRMFARRPELNIAGAVSVAHAIGVRPHFEELDFFAALDDVKASGIDELDGRGAGMLGIDSYSSSDTLYRYATVDLHQARDLLGDDATPAVTAWLRAWMTSIPGANRTATAPLTLPEAVWVVLRQEQPINLSPAFETPLAPTASAAEAVRTLASYGADVAQVWGMVPVGSWAATSHTDTGLDRVAELVSVPELEARLLAALD